MSQAIVGIDVSKKDLAISLILDKKIYQINRVLLVTRIQSLMEFCRRVMLP